MFPGSHRKRSSPSKALSNAGDQESNRSIVSRQVRVTTRNSPNIPGSSLSPRYFLWHNIMGKSARAGPLKCDLQRHVIEKRMKYIRISWRHQIPFAPSLASGIYCMDVDPVDNRFLLCGAYRGEISIVDLEWPPTENMGKVEHRVTPCRPTRRSAFSITCCQWYPQDTSTFVSSGTDGKVKLWDTNRTEIVDEYCFDDEVSEVHWCNAVVRNPLIAVATLSSNIALIDPRTGSSSQNLRWQNEEVSSVKWSLENGNILASGGEHGNIALWDVRSARSHLMSVKHPSRHANRSRGDACIGGLRFSKDGLHLVSLSFNRTFAVWRAHSMKLMNQVLLPTESATYKTSTIRYDICSDDGVLRGCVPAGDDVLVLTLDRKDESNFPELLVGHFQPVDACIYRQKYNQVISSGSDRMMHIWSPDMDELFPDQQSEKVSRLQEDQWSDDEGEQGPSHAA